MKKNIFVHSLFRSSSTYFFKKFRALNNYICFQEPLNILCNIDLLNMTDLESKKLQKKNNHPKLEKSYVIEYHLNEFSKITLANITTRIKIDSEFFSDRPIVTKKIINDYLSVNKNILIQDCKSIFLNYDFENKFYNIYLLRNPRDQFLSILNLNFINHFRNWFKMHHKYILTYFKLKKNFPILLKELSALELDYFYFICFWLIALYKARNNDYLIIHIDNLHQSEYQNYVIDKLKKDMDIDINFHDFNNQSYFNKFKFFNKIEQLLSFDKYKHESYFFKYNAFVDICRSLYILIIKRNYFLVISLLKKINFIKKVF